MEPSTDRLLEGDKFGACKRYVAWIDVAFLIGPAAIQLVFQSRRESTEHDISIQCQDRLSARAHGLERRGVVCIARQAPLKRGWGWGAPHRGAASPRPLFSLGCRLHCRALRKL